VGALDGGGFVVGAFVVGGVVGAVEGVVVVALDAPPLVVVVPLARSPGTTDPGALAPITRTIVSNSRAVFFLNCTNFVQFFPVSVSSQMVLVFPSLEKHTPTKPSGVWE
jgi:hypothetical protein